MALTVIKPQDVELKNRVNAVIDALNTSKEINIHLIDQICASIEEGATYEVAALAVGVHPDSIIRWLKQGEEALEKGVPSITGLFRLRMAQSEAKKEVLLLQRINKAGEGGAVISERIVTKTNGETIVERKYATPNVQADQWFLERKYPKRWGRVSHVEGDISVTVKNLPDTDLNNEIQKIVTLVQQDSGVFDTE
jgi:hypothetical protein